MKVGVSRSWFPSLNTGILMTEPDDDFCYFLSMYSSNFLWTIVPSIAWRFGSWENGGGHIRVRDEHHHRFHCVPCDRLSALSLLYVPTILGIEVNRRVWVWLAQSKTRPPMPPNGFRSENGGRSKFSEEMLRKGKVKFLSKPYRESEKEGERALSLLSCTCNGPLKMKESSGFFHHFS